MSKLIKHNGVWKLVTINERRHLCDVCNHMSYTWKDFDIHKKTHSYAELDRALWRGVDEADRRIFLGNCPT